MKGAFAGFVVDQLAPLGRVRTRKMFGGVGVYCANTFFAIVYDDRLYFRTDERTRPRYLARGSAVFAPFDGKPLTSYYEVPADVLEDSEELTAWARESLATRTGP